MVVLILQCPSWEPLSKTCQVHKQCIGQDRVHWYNAWMSRWHSNPARWRHRVFMVNCANTLPKQHSRLPMVTVTNDVWGNPLYSSQGSPLVRENNYVTTKWTLISQWRARREFISLLLISTHLSPTYFTEFLTDFKHHLDIRVVMFITLWSNWLETCWPPLLISIKSSFI